MRSSIWRAGLAVVLPVLGVAAAPAAAPGGCNTIPERPPFFVGHRGAITSPFVFSSEKEEERVVITIPPDGSVQYLLDADGNTRIDEGDLNITIVFKPTGAEGKQTVLLAGNDECASLPAPTCWLARLFCPRAPQCLPGSAVALRADVGEAGGQISFRFPEMDFAGPVVIAVTPGAAKGEDATVPLELEELDCAELVRPDLIACIDRLAVPGLFPGGEAAVASTARAAAASPVPTPLAAAASPVPTPLAAAAGPAPVFQWLTALAPQNDFQLVCTHDGGVLPSCLGTANGIAYGVERDGNVLIRMSWANILRPATTGSAPFDRRTVQGSSAAQTVPSETSPIFIPSAAFLQSVTVMGNGFARGPRFEPVNPPPAGRPGLTLRGTTDEGQSVLRILQRRLWPFACSGGPNAGQACESNEQDDGVLDCALGSCTTTGSLQYYFCVGGMRDGRPCTRPVHCPGGTACQAGSNCYTPQGQVTGKPCKTDTDCPGVQQCGKGLFDFRTRLNANGVGKLPRTASTEYQGVCENDARRLCQSASACPSGRCIGFRAEATAYEP